MPNLLSIIYYKMLYNHLWPLWYETVHVSLYLWFLFLPLSPPISPCIKRDCLFPSPICLFIPLFKALEVFPPLWINFHSSIKRKFIINLCRQPNKIQKQKEIKKNNASISLPLSSRTHFKPPPPLFHPHTHLYRHRHTTTPTFSPPNLNRKNKKFKRGGGDRRWSRSEIH